MDTQAMTQTQTQRSGIWDLEADSQPINVVWGRLYTKNSKFKSLGIRLRPRLIFNKSTPDYYDLCSSEFSVGRFEQCDMCITENELQKDILSKISKKQFVLKRDLSDTQNPVIIYDLSRNGTFVNGEKIGHNKKRILVNNDVIALTHPSFKTYVFYDQNPNEVKNIPDEVTSKYYISRKLGSGACGVVSLVYDRKTCQQYAMKRVMKNLLNEQSKLARNFNRPERVMNEVLIMKSLEHPCVIKMHDIIDRPDSVSMILEIMKGGDLLTRILSQKNLSERTSKLYFYQMCHSVQYLHAKGITHRDIKPDNILLESDEEDTIIKISDFGLSKFVGKTSYLKTLCGTPLYVAPEVLLTGGHGTYTKKVDIWSLGVVLFTCLSGTLPFSDEYGSPAIQQIKLGRFAFRHRSWNNVSVEAKDLIKRILTVNPDKRPSIKEILSHDWLKDDEIKKTASNLMKIDMTKNEEHIISDTENADQPVPEPPAKKQKTNRKVRYHCSDKIKFNVKC